MDSQPIEQMFDVVKDFSAEMLGEGDETFKRVIGFKVNGINYWIEWWKNISYLSTGTRYATQIPFVSIVHDTCWPVYKKGIKFCDSNVDGICYLAIKKLDWQEKREKS